jgi:hypothetical protein
VAGIGGIIQRRLIEGGDCQSRCRRRRVLPIKIPAIAGKNGDKKTRIASTYVVEKGKPLASPA